MSTTTPGRPAARQLRAELDHLRYALQIARARFAALRRDVTVEASDAEPEVRAGIRELDNRLAQLPREIACAEKCEAAVASLHGKHAEMQSVAKQLMTETEDGFRRLTRGHIIHLLTKCAEVNQVRSLIAAHDPSADLPRPFDARRVLLRAIDELRARILSIAPEAIQPNATLWSAELSVLSGTNGGDTSHDGLPHSR
jgi:hypothetical protein